MPQDCQAPDGKKDDVVISLQILGKGYGALYQALRLCKIFELERY